MHLTEVYAASCGLQISKPFIYEKFFPLPWDKYVLVHAGAGMTAKQYDYFNEVVDILRKIIPEYEIIQIGAEKDPPVSNTVNFLGKTNIHQTAYIIRRASLLIGNDSCNVHIASGFDVPIVAMYGPTTVANHGPYFSSKGKTELIVADLEGKKPSYAAEEHPKTINRIKPEEIAKAALRLLGKDENLVTRQSIFFGHQYNQPSLELVPNCFVDPSFFPQAVPLIRMDYIFNEDMLARNLSARPYRIITDKPLNVNLLRHFKGRIGAIIYDIPYDYSVDFVANIRKLGINYALITSLKENRLADAKLDLFDYGLIMEKAENGAEFLKTHPEITADCKYRTNKVLLADNKFFLNKVRWKQDKPMKDLNDKIDSVELTPDFFDFAENYYIYKE